MSGPDLFDSLLRLHGAEALGREYLFVRLARMTVAGHLDYSEISRILQAIRRRSQWYPTWMAAADRHGSLAQAAASTGATASAGDAYLRAAMCAHWASLYAVGADKNAAHARSLEFYGAGSGWFEPPSRRVEIPFAGDVLPGYLRLPAGSGAAGLALMIGGADTNKEELHHWGTEITRRGLAVLAFDGPGQGELAARYQRLTMRFDTFHEAVTAVIDWAAERHDLPDEVVVFGNSLGGYLALDAGLRDRRIRGVICNGGFSDARTADRWPDGVLNAFASCLGISDHTEIRRHLADHLDLARVPVEHRPPALVVHGGLEDLSDEEEAAVAAEIAGGTLLVIEDAWHTATNRDHLVSPVFADWLLRAAVGDPPVSPPVVRAVDEGAYAVLMGVG